jgi:type VI secretion system protein ImpL
MTVSSSWYADRSPGLNQFPVVMLLGCAGSAKTTTIAQSGLDPELLAGEAFNESSAAPPTPLLNIWLAGNTIFLDPAGGVLANRAAFLRMSAHLAPSVTASLANRDVQPRAAMVCVSCEDFVQPRAAESLAVKARQMREQLADLAASAGASLPVYVLFTKTDRLTHFSEYVANLTNAEAQDVLGATLPFDSAHVRGASPQNETQRISDALFWLFSSLSDKRLLYLAREHDAAKSSAIYEFPRELRKLKPLLVQFLVDLSRPRQLQVNPILRGFYFTGVRPINISDVAPALAVAARQVRTEYADATQIFVQPRASEPAPVHPPGSRRIPQWVYLSRIFPEIVLADRTALESSKNNVKAGKVQRTALIAASVVGLAFAGAWTVSFLGNYRLVFAAREAMQAANEAQPGPGLASAQAMRNLAPARLLIATLDGFRTNGIPVHLRWGLFSGNELYQPVFQAWYGAFHHLLLVPAQTDLISALSHTGGSNNRDYRAVYDALKAYLITTANPDKNPPENPRDFLSPVLVQYWRNGQNAAPDQVSGASTEFYFYSQQLRRVHDWPYATTPDATAVTTARTFLNGVSSSEPLYQQVIARPNQDQAIVFNRLYPGSDRFILNSYAVPAAFTKSGWTTTQANIGNISDYFKGEEWVLGPAAFANIDRTRLQKDLQARYKADFAKHWREYFRRTSVVRFANIKDAANKLSALGSNQSPILELLCMASDNTSVDPSIQTQFQPPQQIAPPGCADHLSSPANDNYMQSLISLQASLTALSTEESSDALRADALAKATEADVAVQQAARKFTIDKEGVIDSQTRNILEAPVKYVEALLAGAGKDDANGAARGFCSQFTPLMRKYPFAPFSAQIATVKEVNDIFAPNQGALWKLYQDHLQKYLLLTGATFSPRPGAFLHAQSHAHVFPESRGRRIGRTVPQRPRAAAIV